MKKLEKLHESMCRYGTEEKSSLQCLENFMGAVVLYAIKLIITSVEITRVLILLVCSVQCTNLSESGY